MKFNQVKGLTLANALKMGAPIRRFPYFRKDSAFDSQNFILTSYNDTIRKYPLKPEDIISSDWEVSDEVFRQYHLKWQPHVQGAYLHIAKEIGSLNTDETIRAVEKIPGQSILSPADLMSASKLFQFSLPEDLTPLFKTHYSLAEALQTNLPITIDVSQEFKTTRFDKNPDTFLEVKNQALPFLEAEIESNYWMVKKPTAVREFIITAKDEGFHKSEKYTSIIRGKNQIAEGEEVTLIEVPWGFKNLRWEDLIVYIPQLTNKSSQEQHLIKKFLGFTLWEVDFIAQIIER